MTKLSVYLKNPDFWSFWAHFSHLWAKMSFVKKLGSVSQFLDSVIIYHHAKQKQKTNECLLRKTLN